MNNTVMNPLPPFPPASHIANGGDWPEPSPIRLEQPNVQKLSGDMLPNSLRAMVEDLAERMQIPMDLPGVAVVLSLAGTVNRRATIQPKAQDSGWVVVPNLWGGIVTPPGYFKTPTIEAVTNPIKRIQAEWFAEYESDRESFDAEMAAYEVRVGESKGAFKRRKSVGIEPVFTADAKPKEPSPKRVIVNDATFEAMHQTMRDNPAGIFVVRDELTGWLSQLDRPGREGERAFCLQAWNGTTGHTIDRIGRGSIHVEACCMSMLGGIQPDLLRAHLAVALRDGSGNDGLVQRFQVLVWPDFEKSCRYVDRMPDLEAAAAVERVFRKLLSLDANNAVKLRFSADAQPLFADWYQALQERIRNGDMRPALASHLSKYGKLMPALALLFELAERAANGGGMESVSKLHTTMAIKWCEYLESHAKRIYTDGASAESIATELLAAKLKSSAMGSGPFTVRDVIQRDWSGLSKPETVHLAVERLVQSGWLRVPVTEKVPVGGRPTVRYELNPKVFGGMAVQRKELWL